MPAQEVPIISLEDENCRQLSGGRKAALHGLKQYQRNTEEIKVSIQYPANNPALSILVYLKNNKDVVFQETH